MLQAGIEVPDELHVVSFNSQADLDAFTGDPQRQAVMHLKNESVRRAMVLWGR